MVNMQQRGASMKHATERGDGRIAYIDALRGFNMIILVLVHVHGFCFSIEADTPSVVCYLGVMMLPLFFFISGFVAYRTRTTWSIPQAAKLLGRKVPLLIMPAFIFLLVYTITHGQNLAISLCMDSKNGYWFTYVLFICFVLYVLLRLTAKLLSLKGWKEDLFAVCCGIALFVATVPSIMSKMSISDNLLGMLSFKHWYYFVFFIFGTLVRKHFDGFQELLSRKLLLTVCLLIFFVLSIFKDAVMATHFNLYRIMTALTSVIIVFALFWKYRTLFSNQTLTGRSLCFIGRRTLDIYFLHYFLLPRQLSEVLPVFTQHPMPVLEFTVSLGVALIVTVVCLFISTVLRLSPLLAFVLFGSKEK